MRNVKKLQLALALAATILAVSACGGDPAPADADPTSATSTATDASTALSAAAEHLRTAGTVSFAAGIRGAGAENTTVEGGIDLDAHVFDWSWQRFGETFRSYGDGESRFLGFSDQTQPELCWKRVPGTLEDGLPGMAYVDYLAEPILAQEPGSAASPHVQLPLADALAWLFPEDVDVAKGVDIGRKTVEVWVTITDGAYTGATLPVPPVAKAFEEAGGTWAEDQWRRITNMGSVIRVAYTRIGEPLEDVVPDPEVSACS